MKFIEILTKKLAAIIEDGDTFTICAVEGNPTFVTVQSGNLIQEYKWDNEMKSDFVRYAEHDL